MMTLLPKLRVIEPNLAGASGHYAEFVRALSSESQGCFREIDVACSARAVGQCDLGINTQVRGVFSKQSRRQEFAELRVALRSHDPFLVLTAQPIHALALEWLAAGRRSGGASLGNARLYFHWRDRSALGNLMTRVSSAVRHHARAIAPTESIAQFLRIHGWKHVMEVPYPILPPSSVAAAQPVCKHLLVAGAARMNKGLELVAGLAELYGKQQRSTQILVQTTPKRANDRRGAKEEIQLQRLTRSGAPGLVTSDAAPNSRDYGERFAGALVLAPYDPVAFHDNVSGVVLDGLLRGAPCVASKGSWPGRLVERFGAGVTFSDRSPEAFSHAIDEVLTNWNQMCNRAQHAARTLADEHNPIHTVKALSAP